MIGIYYGNAWDAKSQPFMSTRLRTESGKPYPTAKVFVGGVLDKAALARYGLPKLTGSFAYAIFMANAAVSSSTCWPDFVLTSNQIGALITHCILFWGGDFWNAYKSAKAGRYDDRHHAHMARHYKEAPWWWYVIVLVISFVLGLVVVIRENITLQPWAYVVALVLGIVIAPFVSYLWPRGPSNLPLSLYHTALLPPQGKPHVQSNPNSSYSAN